MHVHAKRLLDLPGQTVDVQEAAEELYDFFTAFAAEDGSRIDRPGPAGIERAELADGDPVIYEAEDGAFDAHLAYRVDRGTLDVLVRGGGLDRTAVTRIGDELQGRGYHVELREYLS